MQGHWDVDGLEIKALETNQRLAVLLYFSTLELAI
jgi:hypothetical protein